MENEKEIYRILPVRILEEDYRAWRKLAYLNEMSMAKMIRELVKEKINNQRKVLTNSDIAV